MNIDEQGEESGAMVILGERGRGKGREDLECVGEGEIKRRNVENGMKREEK